MKKNVHIKLLSLCSFFLLLGALCMSFHNTDVAIPEEQAGLYKADANRIAIRLAKEYQNTSKSNIHIPQDLVDQVYLQLQQVYSFNHPIAQKVTKDLEIHTFPNPSIRTIKIVYDKNVEWASVFQNGNLKIEDKLLQKYIRTYALSIRSHDKAQANFNEIVLQSEQAINMEALGLALSKLEGVLLVDLMIPNGKGNDIQVEKTWGGWRIDFIYNESSSPNNWSFLIADSGTIEYLGSGKL